MNIVGSKVSHKVFGEGKVVSQDENYIDVQFGDEVVPFQYPYAFERFLTLLDESVAENVGRTLEEQLAVDEEERLAREAEQEKRRQTRERNILLSIRAGRRSRRPRDAARRAARRRQGPAYGAAFKLDLGDELPLDNLDALREALAPWETPAGIIQSGANAGNPIRMKQLKPGHLVVLTQRPEGSTQESERIIRGLAILSDCRQGDEDEIPLVSADPENVLLLDDETSAKQLFWNYYANLSNPENIQWGTGRFRYLSADQNAQILRDLVQCARRRAMPPRSATSSIAL